MAAESMTFTENYETIKQVADTIRNQTEPDIDALVPLVDKALTAYSVCKSRIQAARAILGEKLPAEMANL